MLLATGCTATTGGKTVPAPNVVSRPLTGPTIKQVMLDGAALSKLLNQPFLGAPPFPPVLGGREKLRDRYRSASPADCAGVIDMTQKTAYQSADVTTVAEESWRADGNSVKVTGVDEGVVALRTAADAAALFARFSAQWQKCDGTTVTVPSGIFVQNAISGVRVADSVVAATVSLGPGPQSILAAVPEARALGVRGNCLVEVVVTFPGIVYPSDQGSADINTSAVDIAHAMMDKVSALS
jgi:hypothetical protein